MKKQYMIYHPPSNSSPIKAFTRKEHFFNLNSDKHSPILYSSIGAAKASISYALKNSSFLPERLEELKSFLIEVQIVEVDITIKKIVHEYLFDIQKILKP